LTPRRQQEGADELVILGAPARDDIAGGGGGGGGERGRIHWKQRFEGNKKVGLSFWRWAERKEVQIAVHILEGPVIVVGGLRMLVEILEYKPGEVKLHYRRKGSDRWVVKQGWTPVAELLPFKSTVTGAANASAKEIAGDFVKGARNATKRHKVVVTSYLKKTGNSSAQLTTGTVMLDCDEEELTLMEAAFH
jgi:hypothetical protein